MKTSTRYKKISKKANKKVRYMAKGTKKKKKIYPLAWLPNLKKENAKYMKMNYLYKY